jgi:predicted DNA-binding helix-hairpin-helix protein
MEILSADASLDRESGAVLPARARGTAMNVTAVRMPGGRVTRLVRVMQTNACSLGCGYCPTFAGGTMRRVTLAPEEVVRAFMELHRRGLADGLFLTSGIPGRAVRAMDRMLATAELLRRREGFRGYLHVKALPGADQAQIEAAAMLASRVSVNLEAPTDTALRSLAPDKRLADDLLPKLELAGRLARARGALPAAFPLTAPTTQFVVGAAGERDREILGIVARLERDRLLHHAHFSAFQPVAGTPLEALPGTPAVREARLYQAEHLLRDYGYRFDDLVFDARGDLPLDDDPKTAWARAHPEYFPLPVERAAHELLVRVPGLGPTAARRLVVERRRTVIRSAVHLRRLGVDTSRAAFYLTLGGRRLASAPRATQLRLFAPGQHLTQAPFRTAVPPCAYR